jgi:hypothetical protein
MNNVVTIQKREMPKPTPVEGYLHKGMFRWWCQRKHYWHGHDWDEDDLLRHCPCDCRKGSIQLVSLGVASNEIADRIEAEDPPLGQPRRGETLKGRRAATAWLKEQFLDEILEEFNSPRSRLSTLIWQTEAFLFGLIAWEKLSHGGPGPVRERDLLQEISDAWRRKENAMDEAPRAAA